METSDQGSRVLYTASADAVGGRHGSARSGSGRLEVELSRPTNPRGTGTNPEELSAAGYAACFLSAMAVAAGQLALPTGPTSVTGEVDLVQELDGRYGLRARLAVRAPEADPVDLRRVVDLADQLCPYSRAVRDNVDVEVTLVGADAGAGA
ncbi:Ohr family peroxiredoxin [Nocardioides deserti]|uniref:Ohr family peroxiredoxin n=1 Tax=Nocardioides deserti TaxID=1588644 RepID=A0ABR6UBL3_9ACTN|nr:Ohr family peroxiredoxin [Nocardioides deserti]MBC2961738.1 Ohr family peroxiredoxin [Nocardioides deserti]GGO73112.1 peroxiredoxin [Nocardioides deserti]